MDSRSYVFKETGTVALGQLLCTAVVLGIFALLGQFDRAVLLGGIFGVLIATLNFFFLAVGVAMASDKALQQDVKAGKATVHNSYILRLVITVIVLFALAKSGLCNVITLVLPLAFTRPILTVSEFFRKSGESKT